MRKVLFVVVCLLMIGGLFIACGSDSKPVNSLQSSVIRLHILANSDSESDQDIKIKVRDMLLEKWGKKLMELGDSGKAWDALSNMIPDIQKDVNTFLQDLGADYKSNVKAGVYDFPEKDYDGVEFPEGRYHALKVELGAAAGHNWWCVMFPPLCLIGDNGEMSIEDYKELVKELDAEAEAPEAPVRSWLFDKLFSSGQWDKDFMEWAKEYWVEGDN